MPPVFLQDGLATTGRVTCCIGNLTVRGRLTAAGTSFPCDADPLPACEALGVDGDLLTAPLPIPPWGLIGAREQDLDPVEVTVDVRNVTGGARERDEIAGVRDRPVRHPPTR